MSRKRGKWSLLDPRVDLFEIIEEGVDFGEADSTPILGGKVVNIAYLMILWTGGMEEAYEQWEEMKVGLKIWQSFKDHISQAYRCHRICKKVIAAAYGYVASDNHTQ